MKKVVGGTATQFLYDALNPVQEIQGGAPSANLLTGLNIDEYFQRADSTGTANLLTETLGSTLALTDTNGVLQTLCLLKIPSEPEFERLRGSVSYRCAQVSRDEL